MGGRGSPRGPGRSAQFAQPSQHHRVAHRRGQALRPSRGRSKTRPQTATGRKRNSRDGGGGRLGAEESAHTDRYDRETTTSSVVL